MWKLRLLSSAAAIALVFVACSDVPVAPDSDLQPQFANGGGIVNSATGAGHLFYNVDGTEDTHRVFSFTAREHANGSFGGQFQLEIMASVFDSEIPAITHYLQAEVLCMSVDGNNAWVAGVIKGSSVPGNVGQEVGFRVVDNGQGKSSAPDLITTTSFPPRDPGHAAFWCDAQLTGRFLRTVVQGNIQVR